MSDTAIAEAPAGSANLPTLDAAIEADATTPEAQAAGAPVAPERALPEIDPAVGSLRRLILDHLLDTEEPQNVAMILSAMPAGTSRNTLESALRRSYTAREVERTSPGHYVLAKPKLAEAVPAPLPEADKSEAEWYAAFDAWVNDPESWDRDVLGPRPDEPGRRIPADIVAKGVDRSRKREQRRKDAEAAAARRAEADDALRAKLVAGCFGNVTSGAGINDLSPIKSMLQDVSIEHVLVGLKRRCDKRIDPRAPPIASWREERFLAEVACAFLLGEMLPAMVAAWRAAGTAPAKATEKPEASLAAPERAAPQTAPVPSPANGSAPPPGDNAAELGSQAAALLRDFGVTDVRAVFAQGGDAAPDPHPTPSGPVAAGREAVLAAFKRNGAPQPATPQPAPQPRPATPRSQPSERQAEMTDAAWRFVLEGYVAGNVAWARKHGPRPGTEGCMVPRRVLKEFGL